jgi:chorismate mutase/prephenate dehydratase
MSIETISPDKSLADIRKEIDAIDDALQDLLMQRTALVVKVAEAKAQAARVAGEIRFVPFRPSREAQVLRRLAKRQKGRLSVGVVLGIWREIISAMTRLQGDFRVELFAPRDSMKYWDLARFYAGSATPLTLRETPADVLARVAADPAVIGILPEPGEFEGGDWWSWLAEGKLASVRVAAHLPLIERGAAEHGPGAFVVSQAPFEASGDDTSLVIVTAQSSVGEAKPVGLLAKAGFTDSHVRAMRRADGSGLVVHLIAIAGHVDADDARFAALLSDSAIEAVTHIGGYANPLRVGGETK